MLRKWMITGLVVLACVALAAALMYLGGGWLAKMFRAHMGG